MGPPEMKPSQKSSSGSQIVSQTQFEDGDPADGQDQLHASRPSTPEEQMDSAVDPSEPLEKFDWYDLEVRYHDMIKDRDAVEQQLLQDFDHLSQVGLKTQMTYVHHEEQQLEEKRLHYVQVVNAFRKALELLNGS
ncbi:MAG: hypothetical protein M1822_005669 [Bathelium mastoideum]|nr:MAG: hypothetical protein M1822_005669 [Bathelium mastoideum]